MSTFKESLLCITNKRALRKTAYETRWKPAGLSVGNNNLSKFCFGRNIYVESLTHYKTLKTQQATSLYDFCCCCWSRKTACVGQEKWLAYGEQPLEQEHVRAVARNVVICKF